MCRKAEPPYDWSIYLKISHTVKPTFTGHEFFTIYIVSLVWVPMYRSKRVHQQKRSVPCGFCPTYYLTSTFHSFGRRQRSDPLKICRRHLFGFKTHEVELPFEHTKWFFKLIGLANLRGLDSHILF